MKVLLCLMATVATCSAGLLTGLGGGGQQGNQVEVQVQPQQLQHVQQVQHIAPAPQQQVKIIKIQNLGGGGGYSGGYGGGHGGGHGGGYSHGGGGYGGASYSQPQIIKIIHEQSPASGYAVQGYSSGHSYAPSYSTYQPSLESILPQILKIIFEDSGSSGYQGSAYAGQLVDVYGNSGRAIITKGGNSNDYLRGGHVVEKGHLEVVQVNRQRGGSSGGGGGGGLFGGKW